MAVSLASACHAGFYRTPSGVVVELMPRHKVSRRWPPQGWTDGENETIFSDMALTKKQIARIIAQVTVDEDTGTYTDDFMDWASDVLRYSRHKEIKMAKRLLREGARDLGYRLDGDDLLDAVVALLDTVDSYSAWVQGR